MKERLEQRLRELRKEFESGQRMLADLENQRANLQQTILRISGAIQVLEELLGFLGKEVPVRRRILDHRFYFAAQDTTGSVDFINGHEDDFLEWRFADGHGTT